LIPALQPWDGPATIGAYHAPGNVQERTGIVMKMIVFVFFVGTNRRNLGGVPGR
jgi:hypothetical protein